MEAVCLASATCISTVYLTFKRYQNHKYPVSSEIPSLIISLKGRKFAMMVLTSVMFGGWLYETLRYALSGSGELSVILTLVSYTVTWFVSFILTLSSPSSNNYSDRHYVFVFSFLFSMTTIQSVYHLMIANTVSIWDYVVIIVSFLLASIANTTPQPFHPRDLSYDQDEEIQIKDGNLFRNGLPLSPEATASVLSWATFQWMNPMVVFGFHNPITRKNLYSLTFQHKARSIYNDFLNVAGSKVIQRIYRANRQEIWIEFFFATLACLLGFLGPVFQQLLLEYFEAPQNKPIAWAYFYVFGLSLSALTKLLCNSIQLWVSRRWNVRIFIMLDTELFAKTLRRKETSGKVASDNDFSSVGKITNLMSVDAGKLSAIPLYISSVLNSPIEIGLSIFYLYKILGTAALVGLAVMTLAFPLLTYLSKQYSKRFKKLSSAKDERNNLLNEMIQGIRTVKYFTWEKQWSQKVKEARETEISRLINVVVFDLLINNFFFSVPVLVTVVTFAWYTKVAGHELTASVAFVSISLFEMLRGPLYFLPEAAMTLNESRVSLSRIQKYLEESEVEIDQDPVEVPEGIPSEIVLSRVGFEESVFQWHFGSEQNTFRLNLPRFNFPTGKLSLVVGPTGSGKSSFLYALLGEMDRVSGRVYLPSKVKIQAENYSKTDPEYPNLYLDKVAFVSQQPFLQSTSIRNNILFGLPFDEVRYKKAIYQCALIKDLLILVDGDLTEIGEKGISLSGGQKQRVSLARAVYSYAKTVLLDDCLSAVDAHTSKHILKECIHGDLFYGRTVILVTHHVKLCLPSAEFLLKIDQGNVSGYGSIKSLKASGQLSKLVGQELEEEKSAIEQDEQQDMDIDLNINKEGETTKLIKEETSEKGQVKFKVYAAYFAACGGWAFWLALLVAYVVSRLLMFTESWWLRTWAAAYSSENILGFSVNLGSDISSVFESMTTQTRMYEKKGPVNVDYYIAVYIAITCFCIFFNTLKSILLYSGSIYGARRFFVALTDRIIRAPMRFFDTTPVGRILNRFSKDMSTIDLSMARSASSLFQCVTGIVASVVVMSVITPEFIMIVVVIGGFYFTIGLFYLRSSRELKRLNSVSRSPIFSQFTESLIGVTTIRAYSVQDQFMKSVYKTLDDFTMSFYYLWMTNRWLYVRIEFLGTLVTLFAGIFLLMNMDRIDVGMAGISLLYARNFLEYVYLFIRQYTQVEMNLNAVERVQEYIEIEQEASTFGQPPIDWPTSGQIKVQNLVASYAPELEPVLKGVSFSTKAHEKIGVVGRTGSGKSTLGLCLFRFLEASEGKIWIDDLDITQIGLDPLRSQLTIIPQDAVLFNGTLRSNLDPFGEHSDQAIWESLQRSHLTFDSLDLKISEGGNNFSQGQRQLVCLARALLRKSKVIIMDEATASVDFETDTKIQTTIREEFKHSTLLCIAHRLRTIIDYDQVIVLDQGRIVEFDTPYNLLFNSDNSLFQSLCKQSGEYDTLKEMAQSSF